MKKAFALLTMLGLLGCSAGDLQIEVIDFENTSIQNCGSLTVDTDLLFKLNATEALILELADGLLLNQASDGEITSPIPGSSQLTYRIFSDDVGNDYFCDPIPPASPTVIEEILADEGEVRITTIQDPNDSTRFEHTIRLAGVSFLNSAGERLTNLNVEEYGTISTTAPN